MNYLDAGLNYADEATKKGLALTGLRQRSQKDALTGERIKKSFAWNKDAVNQAGQTALLGTAPALGLAAMANNIYLGRVPEAMEQNVMTAQAFMPLFAAGGAAKLGALILPSPASERKHSEEAINAAILASSKKKGLVFVFKLLLKTLLDFRKWKRTAHRLGDHEHTFNNLSGKELKEKLQKLLYNIAYHSVLTEEGASVSMQTLLANIKTRFDLDRPPDEVTNWKELYDRDQWPRPVVVADLDAKIRDVRVYIHGSQNMVNKRDRRMLPSVVEAIGKKVKDLPPVKSVHSSASNTFQHGQLETNLNSRLSPFTGIGDMIYNSRNHRLAERGGRKRKTIKKKRKRTRKTRKSKRKKRKKRTKKRR